MHWGWEGTEYMVEHQSAHDCEKAKVMVAQNGAQRRMCIVQHCELPKCTVYICSDVQSERNETVHFRQVYCTVLSSLADSRVCSTVSVLCCTLSKTARRLTHLKEKSVGNMKT